MSGFNGELSIGDLWHFAPRDRRESIQSHGLVPGSQPNFNTKRADYISACHSLMNARKLSLDSLATREKLYEHDWDLWRFRLPLGAEVHIQPFYFPGPIEFRIKSRIPASHLELYDDAVTAMQIDAALTQIIQNEGVS